MKREADHEFPEFTKLEEGNIKSVRILTMIFVAGVKWFSSSSKLFRLLSQWDLNLRSKEAGDEGGKG